MQGEHEKRQKSFPERLFIMWICRRGGERGAAACAGGYCVGFIRERKPVGLADAPHKKTVSGPFAMPWGSIRDEQGSPAPVVLEKTPDGRQLGYVCSFQSVKVNCT